MADAGLTTGILAVRGEVAPVKLFIEAKAVLTVGTFDQVRCREVLRLYARADGQERVKILQLLESQIALAKSQDQVDWLMREVRTA